MSRKTQRYRRLSGLPRCYFQPRLRLFKALASLILLGIVTREMAAQTVQLPTGAEEQQNSPVQSSPTPANTPAPAQQSLSNISGTVLDTTGAVVPGARVTLIGASGTSDRVTLTGSSGGFIFSGLAPAAFRISATSSGMGTYVSPRIQLSAGESHELTGIILPIASTSADVRVNATMKEIATEQVKAEEKQRVFGAIPNFYASYNWNAAPLSSGQKFALAFRYTIDPVTFAVDGIVAGIEQASNEFPGYGQGAQGYAKRFGAAYADDAIGTMIGSAILPSLLHQDPRYFYMGSGTVRSRAVYAISSAVICRGDNGHRQLNYSAILGNFASGAISNAYYPASDRGVSLTIRGGFINLAAQAASNLFQEFLVKKLTPKIPKYEQGKP